MKKIQLLVIKSYLGPFLMTFVIAMFILLMQFLWKYIDDLVGKGLDWVTIAELLFYASSTFVPLALPLAVLLSSLMTFGNFGERYELIAMKSAGISLRKIIQPLAIFVVFISVGAFYFSNNILPVANLKMRALLYDVREQKPTVNINEGIFYNGIDNYVIRVGKKDDDDKTIHNIMIYDHTDRMGNVNLTTAESGKMEFTPDKRYLIFNLYNGQNYYEDMKSKKSASTKNFQRTIFKEQYIRIDLSEFKLTRTNEDFFKGSFRMMNLKQLNYVCDSLNYSIFVDKEKFNKNYNKNFLTLYNSKVKKDNVVIFNNEIMKNFDENQRTGIIENALDLARRTKEFIFWQDKDNENRIKSMSRHKIEFHRKYTLSVACFIFFFIGAPLGAIIRRGGFGLPVIISVLFFIFYHVISITGEKSARELVVSPIIGMWISTLVTMPLGAFLTYKATSDSPLLDFDIWSRFFRKLYLLRKDTKVAAVKE